MLAWQDTQLPKNLLVLYPNTRQLISSKMSYRLIVSFTTRQTFAARSFSVAAPRLWKYLPNSLKDNTSIEPFKKVLRHIYSVMLLTTKI